MEIVCLGNEFVEGDSLAVEVGARFRDDGFEVLHVKDSFQLMSVLSKGEEILILDVVDGLEEVREVGVCEIRNDSILSAHDLDAGFVLGLVGEGVRVIGLPREGDLGEIVLRVKELLAHGLHG